jgi:hypothetical protein
MERHLSKAILPELKFTENLSVCKEMQRALELLLESENKERVMDGKKKMSSFFH